MFAELSTMPQWLGAALLGAVLAALGYLAKQIIELVQGTVKRREERRASLVRLRSLLSASRVAYVIQNEHARRLLSMIEENHSGQSNPEAGFERTFEALYERFTVEERELHGIVRGMTEHSLRPVNEALAEWLRNDSVFKSYVGRTGWRGEFADHLQNLEAHLMLWLAKYKTWIPDQPKHALVYMADEQRHGLGFPRGIEELLENGLKRL